MEPLLQRSGFCGEEAMGFADAQRPLPPELVPNAEERYRRTLAGLADVDAGRLIEDEAMRLWVERLGTDQELPVPQPK